MDLATEFPRREAGAYLNSCSYGLLPRRTRSAIERHLARWESDPDWDVWNEEVERARRAFARLIGARDDEVAIQANASSGIASVLSALDPAAPRRRLVTSDVDFPTSPFLAHAQSARGFVQTHLRTFPVAPTAADWKAAIGTDTALTMSPLIASFTGERLDVAEVARISHAAGAPVLVDAFQAAGTFPIDVRKLDVDFLVTGVYKWLLAPVGVAFLYARRDHHRLVPTAGGWYAGAEPYAFDPFGPLAPDARRFQYGGASVVGCVGVTASLGLLDEVGLGSIEKTNGALVERVLAGARARGYEILTPTEPARRGSIVTFRVPDLAASLAALKAARVVVSERAGGIRVSPHFYTEAREVDRLFEVLDAT